jgi:two-component system sensor histidine kinase KdpD
MIFRSAPGAELISADQLRAVAHTGNSQTHPEKRWSIVPVRLGGQILGSLGIMESSISQGALAAIASLIAVGIERARSLEEASRMEASRQGEALKSALIDALAHELKTPLTSIKGALTHLLGKTQGTEEQELLTLANEETDRLHRLMAEILEMARIETGKLQPELRPQNVGEIAFAAAQQLDSSFKNREVKISIPDDLPPANVDFDFIQQALKQLLDNALRYSPADTPILISAEGKKENVIISVTDRGRGIEPDEQSRIFEKFFRGREARYLVPGTGLGLSIAKGIVEAHGGQIWVESKPESGTVFSFSLPMAKD